MAKIGAMNGPIPTRHEPLVQVTLHARKDKTWFWRVKSFASTFKLMGEHWCPQASHRDVDGRSQNIEREIAITGGAIGEHQMEFFGSVFDPSEISALAVQAYRDLCADLEKSHGASVPRMGLRGDGR